MTEAQWRVCEDARIMVEWLGRSASDRKLRLFACAFWRWHEGADCDTDLDMVRALTSAELWAETGAIPARSSAPLPIWFNWHPLFARKALDAANWTIRKTSRGYRTTDMSQAARQQVILLRDIFGNPYRPASFDAAWITSQVFALAQSIYAQLRFDCMPELADALEEAGCADADVLTHCREPSAHVRGCWAVDLILGKS